VKVRIGYGLGTRGLRDDDEFIPLCQTMDRVGYDSIWLSERLTSPVLDPIVALSVAAGCTRRLKLGTSVIVIPGRNLAVLAKELATLDRLSRGRLLLAFGSGASEQAEHQAFGIDPRERGRWMDEAMPLLRRMWEDAPVDHDGPRFHYQGLNVQPKPIQRPLDMWLGGLSAPALRRVGRQADGWLPSFITPAEAAAGRATIEAAASEAGREIEDEHFGALIQYGIDRIPEAVLATIRNRRPELEPTELVPVGYAAVRERIRQFIDAGVSKFVVRIAEEPPSWSDELERAAGELLPLQT
jgi:probable F420-dependent oxidoreductase